MNKLSTQASSLSDRKSSLAPGGRLAEVEVLRTVAVTMVLIDHFSFNLIFWHSHIPNLIFTHTGLWDGVDLFFAISGFVIARSLLPRLAGVTDWVGFTRVAVPFWIARAWRLLPSAWLWLTLPLLLCVVFNRSGAYETFPENWGMFVAGMLDVANFRVAIATGGNIGTAFVQWSLSLEEQFYLLLPFAAFFFRRHLVVPLLIVAFAGFFVPNSQFIFMVRLWPVAFGVLLALWCPHQTYRECAPTGLAKSRAARMGLFTLLLTCLISVGAPSLKVVSFYQGPVALISVILVWIASYDSGYLWQDGWSRRVMEAIAARSYSLYLVHIPVYFAAHEIWFRLYSLANPNHLQAITVVGLALLATACVAELNHRLLEKPLREHGKWVAAVYRARTALETA
jgi:peptidoglycan/LPS O-acetylase OafA/YrhL